MSELESVNYPSIGDYSDLASKMPEIEYRMSPDVEAIYILKLYGRGALGLIDTDPTDTAALSRLSDDISLLRSQNPRKELKPFFAVNFSDELTPGNLYDRMYNCSFNKSRGLYKEDFGARWQDYGYDELNRRTAGGVKVSHLSLRAMIVQRQDNGQIAVANNFSNDATECHDVLANRMKMNRFNRHFPGRVLMNLTDLLMVSALFITAGDPILKPNPAYRSFEKAVWRFRSPFIDFKINRPTRPLIQVSVGNPGSGGLIELKNEHKKHSEGSRIVTAPSIVPIYDSVGITLQ